MEKFDLALENFISEVTQNSPFTRSQAINVFINTNQGLFNCTPVERVIAAMLNINNTIRVYASKTSDLCWLADSLDNYKAPIGYWGGELNDDNMKECYILNQFEPKNSGEMGSMSCMWISNFNSIEEYKAYYKI